MTYRSLLVFLDRDPSCAARVRVAMRLAKDMDCHLVGIAPTGLVDFPMLPDGAPSLAEFAALAQSTLHDQAEQATQNFRDACRATGVASFDTVIDKSDKAPSLVRHAHCSDLTVLTQADPTAPGHRFAQALVEQVVLYSARPTLILPHASSFSTVGSNAMVAWDDTREAARALSDSLPLLRLAKRVHVLSWRDVDADDKPLRRRLEALNQWLVRQGVSAKVHVETSAGRIAEEILARADHLDADLIVMGAYGHARWTERLLGGATRGVLRAMTVPVLMSH